MSLVVISLLEKGGIEHRYQNEGARRYQTFKQVERGRFSICYLTSSGSSFETCTFLENGDKFLA